MPRGPMRRRPYRRSPATGTTSPVTTATTAVWLPMAVSESWKAVADRAPAWSISAASERASGYPLHDRDLRRRSALGHGHDHFSGFGAGKSPAAADVVDAKSGRSRQPMQPK